MSTNEKLELKKQNINEKALVYQQKYVMQLQ